MARITIPANYDDVAIHTIVARAGNGRMDITWSMTGQELTVNGCTQAELEAAFQSYDHNDTLWRHIRQERDRRLAASDWTQLPDVTLTPAQKQAWSAYRQALRDITKQPDPANIVWPTPPA